MNKTTKWVICTIGAGIIGILFWGLLPEKKQPIKQKWMPPVKKDWYLGSDD